jgi:hypothetical protein
VEPYPARHQNPGYDGEAPARDCSVAKALVRAGGRLMIASPEKEQLGKLALPAVQPTREGSDGAC